MSPTDWCVKYSINVSCDFLLFRSSLFYNICFSILVTSFATGGMKVTFYYKNKDIFIEPQIPQTIVSLNLVLFIGPQLLVCFERGLQYTELPEEVREVAISIKALKNGHSFLYSWWQYFQDDAKQGSGGKDFKTKNEKHIDINWPTNGRVEFENYCASYRPGVLSNVLKGITLLIEPCQKVVSFIDAFLL